MKIWVIVVVFLLVGGYMIARINSLDLNDPGDRSTFMGKFWLWMKGTGKNVAGLAGEASKQDWLPNANDTNKSNAVKNGR